jgi:hypothetical protein
MVLCRQPFPSFLSFSSAFVDTLTAHINGRLTSPEHMPEQSNSQSPTMELIKLIMLSMQHNEGLKGLFDPYPPHHDVLASPPNQWKHLDPTYHSAHPTLEANCERCSMFSHFCHRST